MAEKEVTESCVSVGDALAIKEIKPSGTLGYRFIKRLFDLVFSLLMSVLLLIPIAIVCALISLNRLAVLCIRKNELARAERPSRFLSSAAWSPTLAKYISTLA